MFASLRRRAREEPRDSPREVRRRHLRAALRGSAQSEQFTSTRSSSKESMRCRPMHAASGSRDFPLRIRRRSFACWPKKAKGSPPRSSGADCETTATIREPADLSRFLARLSGRSPPLSVFPDSSDRPTEVPPLQPSAPGPGDACARVRPRGADFTSRTLNWPGQPGTADRSWYAAGGRESEFERYDNFAGARVLATPRHPLWRNRGGSFTAAWIWEYCSTR